MDTAHCAIRQDIICCVLLPGSLLTEAQLANRYRCGRAAARSALSRLCQERLVSVVPRHGYRVAPITIKSVRDLFGVRMLLEPAAARLAAGNVSPGQLERLDALCRSSYALGDQDSVGRFLRANTEFHVTVARASGNQRLAEIMGGLLDEMERLFRLGLMIRDRNDEMFHEHHDLVEYLVVGDGARAEEVTADQIRAAEKMVMAALLSSPKLETINLSPA